MWALIHGRTDGGGGWKQVNSSPLPLLEKQMQTAFPCLYIEQHSFLLTKLQQIDKGSDAVFLILEG